jgi:hypothetical protein
MSLNHYLELLDWTGRQLRAGTRGAIPAHLTPILGRINGFVAPRGKGRESFSVLAVRSSQNGWRHSPKLKRLSSYVRRGRRPR